MVLWWTSRPIYLMLSIGCSFRQAWFTASHSIHSLLRKGRPFIMRAPLLCPTPVARFWRRGGHNLLSGRYSRPFQAPSVHSDSTSTTPSTRVRYDESCSTSYSQSCAGMRVTGLCPPSCQKRARRVGHPRSITLGSNSYFEKVRRLHRKTRGGLRVHAMNIALVTAVTARVPHARSYCYL